MKKGHDLICQKRFQEADRLFSSMAADRPTDLAPLRGLVRVARAQKDYELLVERLDRILQLDPGLLDMRILRGQIRAKGGALLELREEIDSLMKLAESDRLTPVAAGQLMQAVQYCCKGSARVLHLQKLGSLVENAAARVPENAGPYQVIQAEILLALGDYEEFTEMVKNLGNKNPPSKKIAQLTRIMKQCNALDFPDFCAPKIFGIGLSRTATSSLNDALTLLGFHSIHWLNPHSRTLISRDDFCLFDAFTDIPVSYQFEVLYHTFPNSRFIYTTRSIESWERSIAFHYGNGRRIQCPSELKEPSATQRCNFAAGHIESNLYGRFESWPEAFLDFDQRVRSFFRDKSPAKFLELGICNGEGWEKLCPFLRKPVPSVPFPNANQSPTRYRK